MLRDEATLAESGIAALQCLKEEQSTFDLILTDLNMPDMDGFTLVEQIRQSPQLAGKAKVIILPQPGKEAKLHAARTGRGRLSHQTCQPVGVV